MRGYGYGGATSSSSNVVRLKVDVSGAANEIRDMLSLRDGEEGEGAEGAEGAEGRRRRRKGRTLEEMIRKEGRKSVPSMIRRKRMAVKQGPPEGVTVKSREEREFDA